MPSDVTYSDQELLAFYDELLSLPRDEPRTTARSPTKLSIEDQDKAVVDTILSRLSPSPSPFPSISSETFSTLLQRRAEQNPPHSSRKARLHALEDHSSLAHYVALSRLTPIIQELEITQNAQASASGQGSTPMKDVPLAILSIDEWRSLTRVCVRTCVAFYTSTS